MSDILKKEITVPTTTWTPGEQPSDVKFDRVLGAVKTSLDNLAKILGPLKTYSGLEDTSNANQLISSSSYGEMTGEERDSFQELVNTTGTETVLASANIARILGSHLQMSPTHIPGAIYLKENQTTGYPIAGNSTCFQLPFPALTPTEEDSFEFTDERGWILKENYNDMILSTDYAFYVENNTVYLNRPIEEGTFIKYNLYVDNKAYPYGSTYNVIPDLRVLALTDEDRQTLTGDSAHFGCCKITGITSSQNISRIKIDFPKIITAQDPLTNHEDGITFNLTGFEPVGKFVDDSNYYALNLDNVATQTRLYPINGTLGTAVPNNTMFLYDSRTRELISGSFTMGENDRTLYCDLSTVKALTLKNDDNASLFLDGASNGYNTRHFFLVLFGTDLSSTISQHALNFSRHRHDGNDAYKIKHEDLLGTKGNKSIFGNGYGTDGGLNIFANPGQVIAQSDLPDNVHPQYLYRTGYKYGGTQGYYKTTTPDKLEDLNALTGDLVFFPFQDCSDDDELPYLDDPDVVEPLSGSNPVSIGQHYTWITWNLNPVEVASVKLAKKRSHALIFGIPGFLNVGTAFGATKLYYETNIPHSYKIKDILNYRWTLERHGAIPGNETASLNAYKGLNIGWGNIFFGYREDILNGRRQGDNSNNASAHWLTSEFNIVTTANRKAGQNTTGHPNYGYSFKDGFTVQAIKGANVFFQIGGSVGAKKTDDTEITPFPLRPQGDEENSNEDPGAFVVLASPNAIQDPDAEGISPSLITTIEKIDETSGAGIIVVPHLAESNSNNQRLRAPLKVPEESVAAKLWTSEYEMDAIEGLPRVQHGGVLDLFCLAPNLGAVSFDRKDWFLSTWITGRTFLRGTYGINLCVDSNFNNSEYEARTGYLKKNNSNAWGPSQSLAALPNSFLNREVRIWGSTKVETYNVDNDDLTNTRGGNINLLYNLGRTYQRFGLSGKWGSDNVNTNDFGLYSWQSARSYAVGSCKPEVYGSAIRQASFVEAFAGFRNDPLQPFTMKLTLPFRAFYKYDVSLDDINDKTLLTKIEGQSIALLDAKFNTFEGGGTIYNTDFASNKATQFYLYSGEAGDGLELDGLVRGAEEIFLENSGMQTMTACFPRSLQSFNISLEYFVPQLVEFPDDMANASVAKGTSEEDIFQGIMNLSTKMVSTNDLDFSGSTDADKELPVVFNSGTGNMKKILYPDLSGTGDPVNLTIENNSILGYNGFLSMFPVNTGNEEWSIYKEKFPLVNYTYAGKAIDNAVFIPGLQIESKTVYNNSKFISYPYRVFISLKAPLAEDGIPAEIDLNDVSGNESDYCLWVEVRGKINIEFISSIHSQTNLNLAN